MATTLSLSPSLPNLSRPCKGREVPLYGLTTSKLLCGTNLYVKDLRIRKNAQNHGIYAAKASTVGREAKKREIVVPDPDYRIPIVLLDPEIERAVCARLHFDYSSKEGISAGFVYLDNLLAAAPVGLLGLLLLFQTTRVRFVFDEEALEVRIGDQLTESGENVFVGGKNRWKYSTFVNWELWWPQFPILVYFKETQTKPEGQVHFFPVIFNGKQLYDVMVERAGPSRTSAPK